MNQLSEELSICRYMSVSAFLMLSDGEAFFPSVKKLREADPLEAAVGDSANKMLWDMIVDGGEQELAMKLIFNEKNAKDKKKRLPDFLGDDLSPIAREVLGEQLACHIAERRAAWCWFASDIESAAMWQIYGHRGIAVKTTVGHLNSALPAALERAIGGITYVDRKSDSDNSIENLCSCSKELIQKPYFLKASEFASEREVRVIIRCADPRGRGRVVSGIDASRLIREVVISPLLSSGESEAIRNLILKKFDPSLNVNQSSLRGDPMLRSIQELGIYSEKNSPEMELPSLMRLL